MKKKLIITAATPFELEYLQSKIKPNKFVDISFEVTGIGMLVTCFNLSKIIYEQKPDYIFQIGIAGCFNKEEKLASTYIVEKEYLADLGVFEQNNWLDFFDLKFLQPNEKPFKMKGFINSFIKNFDINDLPLVKANTINQISTNPLYIIQITKKYSPTLESMEGAALHYVCNIHKIPYLQIRATSNYIGERNKSKWKIDQALKNLSKNTQLIINKSFKN